MNRRVFVLCSGLTAVGLAAILAEVNWGSLPGEVGAFLAVPLLCAVIYGAVWWGQTARDARVAAQVAEAEPVTLPNEFNPVYLKELRSSTIYNGIQDFDRGLKMRIQAELDGCTGEIPRLDWPQRGSASGSTTPRYGEHRRAS